MGPGHANATDHSLAMGDSVDPDPGESLTRREIEVLRLLEARLSNEEIAAILHISTEAVERDTSSIYQKLTAPTALEPPDST